MRKALQPKRWISRKVPGRGISLLTSFRSSTNTPVPVSYVPQMSYPPSKMHSKYFFDMLCSLEPGIVGTFILPELPTLDTPNGMKWFSMVHEYAKECGVFGLNLMDSVFLPAFSHATEDWANIMINMSDYLRWTPCYYDTQDQLYNFVSAIHNSTPTIELCMDFVQCRECMAPCRWCSSSTYDENDDDNEPCAACITRLSNSNSWDCVARADLFSTIAIKCRIPKLKKMIIKGLDSNTPSGIKIMNSIMNTMLSMGGGPEILILQDICTKVQGSNAEILETLVYRACSMNCTTVVLDSWTTIGGIMDDGCYFGGYVPANIVEVIAKGSTLLGGSGISTLTINACSLPGKLQDMNKCVRSILRMKDTLESLTLNCKNSTNGVDSTGMFLKSLAKTMSAANRYTKLPHLKHLTISFGDNVVKRSSVVVAITAINGHAIDTDLFSNESDTEEIMGEDDEIAFSLGHDRMPALKNLVLHCSKDPMATVKMISFLNSLLRVRKNGVDKPKLAYIKIRSIYLPTKLSNPKSEFRRELAEITEILHEIRHRIPYVPGSFVHQNLGEGTGWV